MPFFGVGPPPSLCSRRPHRTLVPLSPSCRAIIQDGTRSLCDLVLDALLRRRAAAVVGSRRPQWTFIPLSPSCRVISQVEKRSMYALKVLDAETRSLCVHGAQCPLWQRTAAVAVCSRRPHRTFIPLSPSCRAIVQVETRSLCAHDSRCPVQHRTGRGTYGAHSLRIDGLLPS